MGMEKASYCQNHAEVQMRLDGAKREAVAMRLAREASRAKRRGIVSAVFCIVLSPLGVLGLYRLEQMGFRWSLALIMVALTYVHCVLALQERRMCRAIQDVLQLIEDGVGTEDSPDPRG
jgi:hypothetical protein